MGWRTYFDAPPPLMWCAFYLICFPVWFLIVLQYRIYYHVPTSLRHWGGGLLFYDLYYYFLNRICWWIFSIVPYYLYIITVISRYFYIDLLYIEEGAKYQIKLFWNKPEEFSFIEKILKLLFLILNLPAKIIKVIVLKDKFVLKFIASIDLEYYIYFIFILFYFIKIQYEYFFGL